MTPIDDAPPQRTGNPAEKLIRAVDRFQQRQPWLAFPIAVWKKFGDDQAGNLAALIAYYAFVSIFPLLLVLVTVLDLVLRHHPGMRSHLLNSAFADFPVIGPQLKANIRSLHETGVALAVGLIGTFLGARGVAGAAQNAFNTVWEVPLAHRPGFPWSMLRSVALILVVGVGEIITTGLSGLAGGTAVPGIAAKAAATAVALLLNAGLFWLGFRLATAREVTWAELRLGALIAACTWQALQIAGGYIVAHELSHASSLYGVFGIVLGLLAWLYLEAEITLYAVELNVVHARGLWPRSLAPPPYTPQDRRAYRLYAQVAKRFAGEDVHVHVPDAPGAAAARGDPPAQGHRGGA